MSNAYAAHLRSLSDRRLNYEAALAVRGRVAVFDETAARIIVTLALSGDTDAVIDFARDYGLRPFDVTELDELDRYRNGWRAERARGAAQASFPFQEAWSAPRVMCEYGTCNLFALPKRLTCREHVGAPLPHIEGAARQLSRLGDGPSDCLLCFETESGARQGESVLCEFHQEGARQRARKASR